MAVLDRDAERREMVRAQLERRGILDEGVLAAMRTVPREVFVPTSLAARAYEDGPLPIDVGQTISQPFIVAAMIEAARVRPDSRVLEIGAGSGYAAAVLSRVAAAVYAIERHEVLAESAARRLAALGYDNVTVRCADGTRGWPEHAPFDAIIVSAGGPAVPAALLEQLVVGGRIVIPVGAAHGEQRLVRAVKIGPGRHTHEDLGGVQFVPLIGAGGWPESVSPRPERGAALRGVAQLLRESAEPIDDIDGVPLDALLARIGDARVVLLGEATHGTSEFYRMRTRITRELVLRRGFRVVAVEADWPDAAYVDRHVRHLPRVGRAWAPFQRFPVWMWRNEETMELMTWIREYNSEHRSPHDRVGFYGLDLYSLYTSMSEVITWLERVDPQAARRARERYGCLAPWRDDPTAYGRAAQSRFARTCEREAAQILQELLERRLAHGAENGDALLDAQQNARLVANAERYYRAMFEGSAVSWNLRDQHMFDTLESILAHRGPGARAVVWEHNSHIGDATATDMGARGEHNVGSLCRARFGDEVYLVGFGTDHGTVVAASGWERPMEVMRVRPARSDSYEGLFHASGLAAGLLHLRHPRRASVRDELLVPRLERAIGVVYRPESERASHYFQAVLPRQFDEYVYIDESRALTPLPALQPHGVAAAGPFGL
jgi:protein-L-isoaspartate(D-aspartate) O-methyltransferase